MTGQSLRMAARAVRNSSQDMPSLRRATFAWHGIELWRPDWAPSSHSLALGAHLQREGISLHLIVNAYWERLDFALPPVADGHVWQRWVDTFLDTPDDIMPWDEAPVHEAPRYGVGPRSVVVLWRHDPAVRA